MPSTYSPSLRIELIANGEQSGTWGTTTNNNLGTLVEQAITGVSYVPVADVNTTLANYNGVPDQARNQVLVITGALTADRDVIAPLVNKTYIVTNQTTGGFAITIKGSSGTGVQVLSGATTMVYCDSLNFYVAAAPAGVTSGSGAYALVNSPTFTGIPLAPTASFGTYTDQIATTAFVHTEVANLGTMAVQNANAVAITGGTGSGLALTSSTFGGTLNSSVVATTQSANNNSTAVATTQYVDSAVTTGTPAGAVMTFAMNTAPTGWLAANGDLVSRTTYATLFSAIGTTFGAGDGTTTFQLPDLRGYFARGMDNGRGVDTGRVFGSNQDATGIADQVLQTVSLGYDNNDGPLYNPVSINSSSGYAGTNRTISKFKVRPYNIALLYCIKT